MWLLFLGLSSHHDPVSEEEEIYSDGDENEDEDNFLYCDASADFEDESSPSDSSTPDGEEPLYPGSDVSFQMAMIAILTFVMCQRLSKECVGQLLNLLKLLLPKKNLLVQSVFLFFSYFDQHVSMDHERHYYCSSCSEALMEHDAVCPRCGPGKKANFFLKFSIAEQLKNLFSQPGFYEKLSYRHNRVKKDASAYEDIYDGNIYKEAQKSYFSFGNWISSKFLLPDDKSFSFQLVSDISASSQFLLFDLKSSFLILP